jgi:hypothetical protein
MMLISTDGALRAGAAQVDITPRAGTQLAGDIGRRRPAELVIDPLFAKALVLESGARKICLVSLDLTAVSTRCADEIRRRAHEELGFESGAVMVHDVQNHAAPALGNFMLSDRAPHIPPEHSWLRGGDEDYEPIAIERIVEAIRQANSALEPVRVGAASGIEGRVAFNRRFVMRDGTTSTHPAPGSPLIRHVEGPVDPELGVICFATESLRMVALLLHFTCHPCHGYPHRFVIGDWPGVWCENMQQVYGHGVVPLVINGCCGNIHHRNHLDPHQVDDYRQMGQILTETSHEVLKGMTYRDDVQLDWRSKVIPIPLREPAPAEIESARAMLAQYPGPRWTDESHTRVDWDWYFAVALMDHVDLRKRKPTFDCQIQAFRIGDAAIVGIPGEPFVEGQLQIKLESPAYPTYVAHHCNVLTGYIPTRRAFEGGGYESTSFCSARLAPDALDQIAHGAGHLLKELFPD